MNRYLQKVPLLYAMVDYLRAKQRRRLTRRWRARLAALDHADNQAIVILMPGAVHIGVLALDYLRGYDRVLCVANGLSDWEVRIVQKYSDRPIVRTHGVLPHFDVIDALLDTCEKPFWLVDHDCYVLDISFLESQRKQLGERAGVAPYTTDPCNAILVPETFLVLLNPPVIRALTEKYGVTSRVYELAQLPALARKRLASIGVSDTRQLEAHKPYFDTLRVLALLAQAEGCGFLMKHGYSGRCQRYAEAIHIGATSIPSWPPPHRYQALGVYFWRKCLEAFANEDRMRRDYERRWPETPEARDIREHLARSDLLAPGDVPDFLDELDRLIARPSLDAGA